MMQLLTKEEASKMASPSMFSFTSHAAGCCWPARSGRHGIKIYHNSAPAARLCLCSSFSEISSENEHDCYNTFKILRSSRSRKFSSRSFGFYGKSSGKNAKALMNHASNYWSFVNRAVSVSAQADGGGLEGAPEGRRHAQFVNWFREAWPYIQGYRGSTFVVVIPGEVISHRHILDSIIQDISLLHGLGIKIVIAPGSHIEIDELLKERGRMPKYVGAYRITDKQALDASMEAAGRIRVDIEAKLSRGPSIPILRRHGENGRWHEAGGSVASGNFLAAKRRGVIDGIDFGETGEVKKIDVARIKERLDNNCIVMLSNLGYSSSGEVLNCNTYEVATACAIALQADKLICLLDGPILDEYNQLLRFMTLQQADQLIRRRANQSYTAADYVKAVAGPSYVKSLGIDFVVNEISNSSCISEKSSEAGLYNAHKNATEGQRLSNPNRISNTPFSTTTTMSKAQGFAIGGEERLSRTYGYLSELTAAVYACRGGVRRVHLLNGITEGVLLLELYTRDGIGTMVSSDIYEGTRPAKASDILGIDRLLCPLEESGALVNRPRQQLLEELDSYTVVERDGSIIACCALFLHHDDKRGEVAAFVVSPECRGRGQGDSLLDYLEKKAVSLGLEKLFLLTTRTADWFVHRGFSQCTIDIIPTQRRSKINFSRGSKYYVKSLQPSVNGMSVGVHKAAGGGF